ncbi:hypothetical protein SAMN06295967_11180 [Belliella buryatensis]|uniref:Uncharacterized protein n=1 Tax=Belliella buryatensis TaxID=1500549 RepID=A0A239F4R4_9BACT|nr:hypothetical protein [Belliella buryatensis]SNS51094.1 hypothetical protein SAMN06295967_11180 [Belliella buryatensis]
MRKNQIFLAFVIILCLIFPDAILAQKEYKGEYKFNNINGEATFQFIEGPENSVIRQGDFSFLRKERDPENKTRFLRTVISGAYEQGQKAGTWEYLDEDHQAELKDVVDFELISDLKSAQIKLKANYIGGVPNGTWVFEENEFSDGSLKKKAQADEFQFREGNIRGKFNFKSFVGRYTHFIRGELKDDGIMTGEWTFVYEEDDKLISEVRNYENGFLLGLVKRDLNNDEVLEEIVFFETIAKLNKVNAGDNQGFRIADQTFGILFNDGFLSNTSQYKAQQAGNAFLSDFLIKILRYDPAFVNNDSELIDYPLHTRKFVFELNRSQQKIVEDLPGKFDDLMRLVEQYKDRNALSLNRQRSDSLSAAYSFFEFQYQKLKAFNELIGKFRNKDIQFYDVKYMVEEGLIFVTEKDEVKYSFQEEDKTLEIEYRKEDFNTDFYVALDAYITQMAATTSRFKTYVDGQLSRIEEDADLKTLEERIQDKKTTIDELFADQEGQDGLTQGLIRAVKTNVLGSGFEKINERYAKANRFNEKKDEANVMLDLLDEMEGQYEVLSNVSRNWEILDEFYQEEVFNPFTYTRYDQRAKPRLFEAAERLFENYVENIEVEEDYTQIKVWTKKIESLIMRMTDLRNADTRSLERRLNRRSSISKIESDLEL